MVLFPTSSLILLRNINETMNNNNNNYYTRMCFVRILKKTLWGEVEILEILKIILVVKKNNFLVIWALSTFKAFVETKNV